MIEKEGPFGLSLPVKYEIKFEKLPDSDEWKLFYAEEIEPSIPEGDISQFVERISKVFHGQGQMHVDGRKVWFEKVGSREALAAGLMGEFLAVTDIGKMTLMELFILAGLAYTKIDKVLEEAIKKGEIHT
mgnify:FL=1